MSDARAEAVQNYSIFAASRVSVTRTITRSEMTFAEVCQAASASKSVSPMMFSGAPFGAWNNIACGLEPATALKFVQTLRLMAADTGGNTHFVAIYQASESIYDLFDKAVVLCAGRQIYFDPASGAKEFFERMG